MSVINDKCMEKITELCFKLNILKLIFPQFLRIIVSQRQMKVTLISIKTIDLKKIKRKREIKIHEANLRGFLSLWTCQVIKEQFSPTD